MANPKVKLLDRVRQALRLKYYSLATERAYCDWIRRYILFHRMQREEELQEGKPKIEAFLTDLALRGRVSASTHRVNGGGKVRRHPRC